MLAVNLFMEGLSTAKNVIYGFASFADYNFSFFKKIFRLDAQCVTENLTFQNEEKENDLQ